MSRHGRALSAYVAKEGRSERDIGEVERTVMVLRAAGLPARLGGRDLVAEIRSRRRGDGSIAGYVSYTAFGILALRSAGQSAGSATVRWLSGSQNADGGFGVARSAQSDTDMTGATLQALAVTGRARGRVARRAVGYLRSQQNRDGGFGQMDGRDSNSQSTSYAVQGLVAVGSGGSMTGRALGYLRRRQASDGSVAYSADSEQTPVWVTAQALMALRRTALPIAAVARAPKPAPAASSAAADSETETETEKKAKATEQDKPAQEAQKDEEAAGGEGGQGGDGESGGGRVKLDADVKEDKPPPAEHEPGHRQRGGAMAHPRRRGAGDRGAGPVQVEVASAPPPLLAFRTWNGSPNHAERLRALHHGDELLVLANVWDVASARLVAGLGHPAVATASAAVTAALGHEDDDSIPPDEMFAAVARIAAAVDVPVTADVEAGYRLDPGTWSAACSPQAPWA